MGKWYFTCGQIHRHELSGGKVWDKDGVIVVEAETEQEAADFVFDVFGRAWSGIYDDFENIEKYYKSGVVHEFKVEKITTPVNHFSDDNGTPVEDEGLPF